MVTNVHLHKYSCVAVYMYPNLSLVSSKKSIYLTQFRQSVHFRTRTQKINVQKFLHTLTTQ